MCVDLVGFDADWHDSMVWVQGLFNFKPAVRPVPLEAHIQGYPGKFYCPRMASMNKPSYAAIQNYSPNKPILIFVSSRRQTRLTALDLIAFAASDMRPNQWMHMNPIQLKKVIQAHLKLCNVDVYVAVATGGSLCTALALRIGFPCFELWCQLGAFS